MDAIKILKRSWKILWSYRALWAIGLILALTTGYAFSNSASGSSGRDGSGSGVQTNQTNPFQPGMSWAEFWHQVEHEMNKIPVQFHITSTEWTTFLWILIGGLVLLLVVGIGMAIARYVAETATIRMVDEYERSGEKCSVRQGLRYGWSRTAWRLFLINLLVSLPMIFLVLFALLIGLGVFLIILADNTFLTITGIIAAIGLTFLLIFLGVIIGIGLSLLRDFFWRACVLEQVGVREAIRQGWNMVMRNWKSVGLMWLIMIAVRIAWGLGLLVALILCIPLLLVTGLAGILVGGLPTLLVGGISSLFLSGPLPWIVGLIAGLPFFLLVAFSPLFFLRGLELIYNSTVWTLTYRELQALQSLKPSQNEAPLEELNS
jgi:hypothetical protein